jgi:hypothetical protein
MSEEEDVPEYRDRYVYCPHLLLCRSVWFDNRQPERGFSLAGIHKNLPEPDDGLPLVMFGRFVYFQIFGTPGEYFPRIRIVRVIKTDYDEEEVQLGEHDEPLEYSMPTTRPVELNELSFVDEHAFRIDELVFHDKGIYELQLWIDGFDEPAGTERIRIGEVDQ